MFVRPTAGALLRRHRVHAARRMFEVLCLLDLVGEVVLRHVVGDVTALDRQKDLRPMTSGLDHEVDAVVDHDERFALVEAVVVQFRRTQQVATGALQLVELLLRDDPRLLRYLRELLVQRIFHREFDMFLSQVGAGHVLRQHLRADDRKSRTVGVFGDHVLVFPDGVRRFGGLSVARVVVVTTQEAKSHVDPKRQLHCIPPEHRERRTLVDRSQPDNASRGKGYYVFLKI